MHTNQNPKNLPVPEPVFLINPEGKKIHLDTAKNTAMIAVIDYGAKGNGNTDDTVAIQSTIDNSPEGATIYFPPGTYIISNTIQLKKGQNYVGGGFNTVIKQAKNVNLAALMAVTEYVKNVNYSSLPIRLSNLYFDGNSAQNTIPPHNGGHGIVFMSSNSIIEECWFYNIPQTAIVFSDRSSSGIVLSNSSIENHVVRCKIQTVGQFGIWVRDQDNGRCTDGYIRDCVISGTADTAIFIERGAGWFLSGNHIYGCQRSGIIVNNAWSTNIIGNEIDGYGYSMASGSNYCTGLGVTCIGPRATVVQGNIISTPEANPNTIYQHLCISGDATTDTRCLVIGNDILGGYVNATSSTPIQRSGSYTIAVSSITNMTVGQRLTINNGASDQEHVTISALDETKNTIVVYFNRQHHTPYTITSRVSVDNSTGITVQSLNTQQNSGQLFYVQVAMNMVDGVGKQYVSDLAPTTILADNYIQGDLQTSGSLKSANHLLGNGPDALISIGKSNGRHAPYPNLSGNDIRGTISFGCGAYATQGVQVILHFATSYSLPPCVVISPANSETAQLTSSLYVSNIAKTGFSIASNSALATTARDVNTFCLNYQVIG